MIQLNISWYCRIVCLNVTKTGVVTLPLQFWFASNLNVKFVIPIKIVVESKLSVHHFRDDGN